MGYYLLQHRVSVAQFTVTLKAGSVNLADSSTKHHPSPHNKALRSIHLFDTNFRLDLQGRNMFLTDCATGKKHAHKVKIDNKSTIQRAYKQRIK